MVKTRDVVLTRDTIPDEAKKAADIFIAKCGDYESYSYVERNVSLISFLYGIIDYLKIEDIDKPSTVDISVLFLINILDNIDDSYKVNKNYFKDIITSVVYLKIKSRSKDFMLIDTIVECSLPMLDIIIENQSIFRKCYQIGIL